MKGVTEEIMYFVIMVLAATALFFFFSYQRGVKGIEVKKSVEERSLSEEITMATFALFNNKLPFVEKTYLQCWIDSVLQGSFSKKELDRSFYGTGIGEVNVTEIIPPLLDKYARGRWELRIITPDGTSTYGGVKGEVIYSYESPIPVPEGRIGKIILLLGEA